MKRFAAMEDTSAAGVTSEELEAKRKARMERFGEAEVKEAQRSVTEINKQKGNRRKEKLMRKMGQGGDGKKTLVAGNGDRKRNRDRKRGHSGQKRFKRD